jgi:hypothetical protein
LYFGMACINVQNKSINFWLEAEAKTGIVSVGWCGAIAKICYNKIYITYTTHVCREVHIFVYI